MRKIKIIILCLFLLFFHSEILTFGEKGLASSSQICGIENCHGLDVSCGANVPEACTMIYRLGDFCRKFAKCEIKNGTCQFVQNRQFEKCKDCVQQCDRSDHPLNAFQCESDCLKLFD